MEFPSSLSREPFDRQYFEASSRWLSNPELQKLIMAPEAEPQGRLLWFQSLQARDDYWIWGIGLNGHPIGCFGIKHVDVARSTGEYWGYIGEPHLWGKRIGPWMLSEAATVAHSHGLDSLYLRVWVENLRAIRLYRRVGFLDSTLDGDVLTMAAPVALLLR